MKYALTIVAFLLVVAGIYILVLRSKNSSLQVDNMNTKELWDAEVKRGIKIDNQLKQVRKDSLINAIAYEKIKQFGLRQEADNAKLLNQLKNYRFITNKYSQLPTDSTREFLINYGK